MMTITYRLFALTVLFGVVLAVPHAKVTSPYFDDLAYVDTPYEIIQNVEPIVAVPAPRPTAGLVVKSDPISSVIRIVTSVVGLKAKALALAVLAIEWLVSKSFLLAIGVVGTFAFCKLTNKCNLASPAVYRYVPPQVRSFVTPERLEDAQQFLMTAMQQYADKKGRSVQ